nr:RNA-directed DNA polymerase, eukaryota [Tanacetum cinerariifolium]
AGLLGWNLCVWDSSSFHKKHHTISDNFVAVYESWTPTKTKLLIISIYAPQHDAAKRVLWDYVSSIINRWDGDTIVMGDFNEIHNMGERMGSVFNSRGASEFNSFIDNSSLVEVQLEGFSFTWSHPSAKKMSKLDRFLVSKGFTSLFPRTSAICLDKHLSDHRPILLREVITDYGASPFRFYHSWFKLNGFDDMTCNVREIKQRLHDIDIELDQRGVNNEILLDRKDLLKQLQDIKALESIDYAQKAKIQWAIEGDENSKFYHGIINRKRANLSIKGIMVDGEWVDDPLRVKAKFCNHFSKRFQVPGSARGHLNFLFSNRLSQEQADDLEILISRDEIRAAVWDCGVNKS